MSLELYRNWLQEVDDLCDIASATCELEEIALVQRLHRICLQGPAAMCAQTGARNLEGGDLDRLLKAGATESAAIRLVRPCGYMLSLGELGIALATIDFPGVGEVSFSGDSESIALCGALATALSQAMRLSNA